MMSSIMRERYGLKDCASSMMTSGYLGPRSLSISLSSFAPHRKIVLAFGHSTISSFRRNFSPRSCFLFRSRKTGQTIFLACCRVSVMIGIMTFGILSAVWSAITVIA